MAAVGMNIGIHQSVGRAEGTSQYVGRNQVSCASRVVLLRGRSGQGGAMLAAERVGTNAGTSDEVGMGVDALLSPRTWRSESELKEFLARVSGSPLHGES